jgi:hypothetical protein
VGYNGIKALALFDTMEENLLNILRLFLVISRNEVKPLHIPQRRKTFSIVSQNG